MSWVRKAEQPLETNPESATKKLPDVGDTVKTLKDIEVNIMMDVSDNKPVFDRCTIPAGSQGMVYAIPDTYGLIEAIDFPGLRERESAIENVLLDDFLHEVGEAGEEYQIVQAT